jgi:hypothetical protein
MGFSEWFPGDIQIDEKRDQDIYCFFIHIPDGHQPVEELPVCDFIYHQTFDENGI